RACRDAVLEDQTGIAANEVVAGRIAGVVRGRGRQVDEPVLSRGGDGLLATSIVDGAYLRATARNSDAQGCAVSIPHYRQPAITRQIEDNFVHLPTGNQRACVI